MRADRFVAEKHGQAYRAGRARLREILGGYLDQPPEALAFEYNAHGKPSLPDGPAFNLSHSGGWAALAVTDQPIGVDIEAIRPVEAAVAKRFFTPVEQAALAAAGRWDLAFFQIWTRKEAFVKACGPGLSMPLSDFDVSLEAPRLTRLEGGRAEEWIFHLFTAAPEIPGALVVQAKDRPVRVRLR